MDFHRFLNEQYGRLTGSPSFFWGKGSHHGTWRKNDSSDPPDLRQVTSPFSTADLQVPLSDGEVAA